MNQYLSLLRQEPVLARLSLIQLISYFGAWFSNVAIYTLLIQLEVSAVIISLTAAMHFVAGIVQAPFSGTIIDRIQPKKLMLFLLGLEVIATLCLLSIATLHDIWFLFVLIFVRMAAASFYFTAEMSLLPRILPPNHLQKANEIHSIIWSFSYTLGMAVSGFVVYAVGVYIAFLLDAALFVLSLFLLYGVELNLKLQQSQEGILEMMRDTFRYLKRHPLALHLILVHAFVGLTTFDALIALMVDQYYASIIAVSLALGFLNASRALGLVFGPMILGNWVNNKRLVYLFIGQAFAILLWALVMKNFYLSLVLSFFVGFFTTTLWSYTYTLLQKNIEEKYYGRIVAYNDMVFLLAATFTSLSIGFFAKQGFSVEFTAVFLGSGFLFAALYFYWINASKKLQEV